MIAKIIFGIAAAAVVAAGAVTGVFLVRAADQSEPCPFTAAQGSWEGLQVSGLPDTLQLPFGYGRGTRAVQDDITVTSSAKGSLPRLLPVFAGPLVTDDDAQMIPAANPNGRGTSGVYAIAKKIGPSTTPTGNSSLYEVDVCVTATNVGAGSYSGQLIFPGTKLASGGSLPVTVTLQSRLVPYALTVGGLPLALCGMFYTTLVLLRRANSTSSLAKVVDQLWSSNGLVALVLSVGAVFTAWNVQVFRNPTWGSPWPAILVAFVTMAGAAAGASTVPMGFAKDPSAEKKNADNLRRSAACRLSW
jgi:hypothetical protein